MGKHDNVDGDDGDVPYLCRLALLGLLFGPLVGWIIIAAALVTLAVAGHG